MNKKIIALIVLIVLGLVLVIAVDNNKTPVRSACTQEAKICPDGSFVGRMGPLCEFAACPEAPVATTPAYENISYMIEGTSVALKDGISIIHDVPGSASATTTKYFGNLATGDLNSDASDDVAFLITQDGGGSGTFYYLVAALKQANGTYLGTNAVLLGDRIAPQTTEIKNGRIIENYADRKPTDPMSTPASIGVTSYFKITDGKLVSAQ